MDTHGPVREFRHSVTRLSVDVHQPYGAFRRRYEQAVPAWPEERCSGLISRGATWEEVAAEAAAASPIGLFTFWRHESAPLMRLAGHQWECTSYLLGSHIVVEHMYGADPSVMTVAPFHASISVGTDGATRLTFDQPSTHLASFDDPVFAVTAVKVDAKFAQLLALLEAPVPPALLHTPG